MMVDTRIYGYVTDGATYHPACTDARPGDEQGVSALFYLDDEDPHGLTCDACSEYIFEPVTLHEFDPERDECEYGCRSYCGEGVGCELHVQSSDDDDQPAVRVERDERGLLELIWTTPSSGHPAEED